METSGRNTHCLTAPFKVLEESSQNNKESMETSGRNTHCLTAPFKVLEESSQNKKHSWDPASTPEKDSQMKESTNKAMYLSEMNKVSEETAQNNDRQCLSNKKHRTNQTPQTINSKSKKITPTYIVVKNFGTPIIISETNLQIAQTASCANNGMDNKTLDTTLQENKLSIESIVHKLLTQLDQFTNP